MNNYENQFTINCIVLELEQIKSYIKELETRIKELEKK